MNTNADEYQDNFKQVYLDNGDLLDNEYDSVNGQPAHITSLQTQMSNQHKQEGNKEEKDNG